MKHWMYCKIENINWMLAKLIPNRLKYYAFNLVLAHSTTGNYGSEDATAISWQTISKRFAKDYKL